MKTVQGSWVAFALFAALIAQGVLATPAASFTAGEILSLKKAGVSEDVITLMIEKHSDVTGVLTAPDALSLKAGGVSDRVLRALLLSPAQAASLSSFLPVRGILRLKKAGISDAVIRFLIKEYLDVRRESEHTVSREIVDRSGRKVIVYGDGAPSPRLRRLEEKLKEAKAWDLLKQMGLIVDRRP